MPKVSEEYFDIKREEIINAAYKVALSKSISSITLKDVRDEVGMARGGIYRYYNNLDEILSALIVKVNKDTSFSDDIQNILGENSSSEKPDKVLKELCKFIEEYMTSLNPDVLMLSIQFDIFCIHEPKRILNIMKHINTEDKNNGAFLCSALTEYIKRETKKGNMKPVMPVDDLVEYFLTIYKGILLQYSITQKIQSEVEYDTKSIFKGFYETLISLLGCNR
ncbi:MAG: TetR/AcrR family transcriptional regulator [Eubacterium sp.]|nr:TetR/AcrR family transcriptional regulator [Eubacterium sp.]